MIDEQYTLEVREIIGKYKAERDFNNLSDSLLLILKDEGIVHLNELVGYDFFNHLSNKLGEIIHFDNIEVKPNGKYGAYRADDIPLHTDSADAHIMGWWCSEQDEFDGASLLVDSKIILTHFNSEEINILKSIKLKYSSLVHRTKDSSVKFDELPLVYERWGELKLNYAPWLELVSTNLLEEKIISKFLCLMEKMSTEEVVSVRLKAGECLFIDNGRFLHSRKKIAADSKRCLKRMWINTGDK